MQLFTSTDRCAILLGASVIYAYYKLVDILE